MSLWAEVGEDLRQSVRSLRRRPGFTLAALATLTLGLGAASGLMSLVDSILLAPLPYPEAERIHAAWFVSPTLPGGLDRVRHSHGTYVHWRDRTEAFESFALAERATVTLDDGVQAIRVVGARVTADIHGVLGRDAAVGRSLRREDMAPGAEPVVLLSDALWGERFGRSEDALGRLLNLDGISRRIVGVLPADVRFPTEDARLWVPMTIDESAPGALDFLYTGYGRLAPGQDLASAEADFLRLVDLLPEAMPASFPRPVLERAQFGPRIEPLEKVVLGDSGPVFALLGVAVLVLLAIVGANLTSLAVVRTERRLRSLAVRAAAGATIARLRRALLVEGLALAWVGAGVGVFLARPALRAFAETGGDLLPRLAGVGLTPGAVAVTLLAATLLGVVAGMVPALRVGATRLSGYLRSGAGDLGGGRSAARVRQVLVAAQVALAVVLVLNAGLLVRSFQRLTSVETGFEADGVLTAGIALEGPAYAEWGPSRSVLISFLDDVSALAGVTAASLSNHLPLRQGRIFRPFIVEDVPSTSELPQPQLTRVVTDGYFETLGIDVVDGRALRRDDLDLDRPVAVVSRSLARTWWPGQSALGRRLRYTFDVAEEDADWFEVVGVADDVRDRELGAAPPSIVYVPFQERHLTNGRWSELSVSVRAAEPRSVVEPLRVALAEADRGVPLYDVRTMARVVRDVTSRERTVTTLLVSAAGLALFLSTVGLYGVLSFIVGQRRREMGLRLALGAEPGQVRGLVLRQAAGLVGAGLAGGVAMAALTRQVVARSLFETDPGDPVAVGVVLVVLATVAALATYGPALRASKLSPTISLKED